MTVPRLRFADIVPYELPDSLEALRGPSGGWLELPHAVHWGPVRLADLDDHDDLVGAYQAVVREGSRGHQEELLHAGLLRAVWPELSLPVRCRRLWEETFPVLSTGSRSGASA